MIYHKDQIHQIDQYGHTGDYPATVNMIEFIDECLSRIIASADMNFYKVILLSTHGNVENMIDDEGKALTTNTTNEVPFLITDKQIKLTNGTLASVAPTLLSYMNISIPSNMRDSKLLIKD